MIWIKKILFLMNYPYPCFLCLQTLTVIFPHILWSFEIFRKFQIWQSLDPLKFIFAKFCHQMKHFSVIHASTLLTAWLQLRLAGLYAPCCYCLWPSTLDRVATGSILLCNQERCLSMEEENPFRCQSLMAALRSHAASEQKLGVTNRI